jgi:phage gp29-like protein
VNSGEELFPEIEFFDSSLDEKSMAERDTKLNALGVNFTAEYFKRTYGLAEDEFTMGTATNQNQIGGLNPSQNAVPVVSFAEGNQKIDGQDWIDGLLDKVGSQNFKEMSMEFLKPVFDLVGGSKDYNEILESLGKTFPMMETNKLESVMSKAIFLAEATGIKSVQNETETKE